MWDFWHGGVLWATINYCRDQRQGRGELILLLNQPHRVPARSEASRKGARGTHGLGLQRSQAHGSSCELLGADASRSKAGFWCLHSLHEAAHLALLGFRVQGTWLLLQTWESWGGSWSPCQSSDPRELWTGPDHLRAAELTLSTSSECCGSHPGANNMTLE